MIWWENGFHHFRTPSIYSYHHFQSTCAPHDLQDSLRAAPTVHPRIRAYWIYASVLERSELWVFVSIPMAPKIFPGMEYQQELRELENVDLLSNMTFLGYLEAKSYIRTCQITSWQTFDENCKSIGTNINTNISLKKHMHISWDS